MKNSGNILRVMFKQGVVLFGLMIWSINSLVAQFIIKDNISKEDLVSKVLLKDSSGLAVKNIKYTGSDKSIGVFYTTSEVLPMKKGIVISTGLAASVDGPNETDRKSSMRFTPGDHDLDSVAGNNTADAAILEFVFYPNTDEIAFDYFFASEEYPEFVNHGVNDVFVFFISGPGYDHPTNIAKLPTTGEPITVDHVNQLKNTSFYVPNKLWGYELDQYTIEEAELAYGFEFDGMTTMLEARAKVVPYQPYKLKIAIADVGDNVYDSSVFLRSKSLRSCGQTLPFVQLIEKDIQKKLVNNEALSYRIIQDKVVVQSNIQFDFNSYDLAPDYFETLNELVTLLNQYFDVQVTLVGHTDDVGTDQYNMDLSLARAKSIRDYLVNHGVDSSRITVVGKGNKAPLTADKNEKGRALNRRVEFIFQNASL